MGTSSSSSGPNAGISFDPPWLDSIVNEIGSPLAKLTSEPYSSCQISNIAIQPEFAPPRRFGNARRALGEYISSGNRRYLKKALGSYSKKGMGGASKVANRMNVSTSIGAGFFNFLQGIRDSVDIKVKDWVNQLASKHLSVDEITDAIIDHVISTGGSLDEESCRDSMAQAMSELLRRKPEVDLLNMNNDNIWMLMEQFLANETFNRINLDIGQFFESSKYSPREMVSKMNEIRSYLKSEISSQLQKLRTNTQNPSKLEIHNLLQLVISNTFEVFEEE